MAFSHLILYAIEYVEYIGIICIRVGISVAFFICHEYTDNNTFYNMVLACWSHCFRAKNEKLKFQLDFSVSVIFS